MSEPHHHFSVLEFDCDDVLRVATFWATILALPVDPDATADYAQITPPEPAPKWLFIRRPRSGAGGLTLALTSYDLGSSTDEAVAAGASSRGLKEAGGFRWSELTDPEGNAFTFNAPPPE